MKIYLTAALILLIPAVSAWDRCYCLGNNQQYATTAANMCCTDNNGISFPNTSGDVLGRWDGNSCVYSIPVRNQNSEYEASVAFAACCRPTGGQTITGGVCFQR